MDKSMKNNWDEIGEKISGYTPDEYTSQDWDAMDNMLNNGLVKKQWYYINTLIKGLGGVVVLVVGGYFIFQNSFQLKEEKNNLENIVSIESNKNRQIEDSLENSFSGIGEAERENAGENSEKEKIVSSAILSKENNGLKAGTERVNKNGPKEIINKNKTSNNEPILIPNENEIDLQGKGGVANMEEVKSTANSGHLNSPFEDGNSNLFEKKGGELTARNKMRLDIYEPIKEVDNNGFIGSENKNNHANGNAVFTLPILGFPVLKYSRKVGLGDNEIDVAIKPTRKISWGKIRFGAMVGLNTTVTDYSSMSTSTLPLFGVFANKRIKEKLELQVEVHVKFVDNYDVKAEWEDVVYGSSGIVGTERLTQHYDRFNSLDVPVILKYNSSSRIGFLGGARFSYLGLGQSGLVSSFSTNGVGAVPLSERVPQYGFWKYDVNLVLGAECYLASRWVADLRYNQGFLDITPDNLYQDDATHLNSDLQFSLRYIF